MRTTERPYSFTCTLTVTIWIKCEQKMVTSHCYRACFSGLSFCSFCRFYVVLVQLVKWSCRRWVPGFPTRLHL